MLKWFLNKFKDDRKYFAIVFFILILFLLSGIITPFLVKNKQRNWNEELTAKITSIKESVTSIYKQKENRLLGVNAVLKNDLKKVLNPGNTSYGSLIKLITDDKYKDYSAEVFAPNGKLIAWNDMIAIPQEELFPLEFPAGEVYFSRNKLITYLCIVDTFHVEGDIFYFALSFPIEKHYSFQNQYYIELSFTNEISGKFYTQFEVSYHPYDMQTKDGRKFSFEILNNKNNKTGIITFVKPALDTSTKSFYADVTRVQSFLVVLGFFFIAFAFRKDYRELKFRFIRLLILLLYFTLFRVLLYYVNFPANLLEGSLTDPSYFSSTFGGGIVKSPIEFFITALLGLIISIVALRYILDFVQSAESQKYRNKKTFFILVVPLSLLFFLTTRGISAAIRSVIFDSTLRYFKEPTLIPDFPSTVMNFNILIFGVTVVLLLCAYIILLFSLYPETNLLARRKNYFKLFFIFLAIGVLFNLIQKHPLITPLIGCFFTLLVFILAYHIYFLKRRSVFNFVYATLCASIISITLMNYFNFDLERESLKTTALEINRPNDNLLRFLITETLASTLRDERLLAYLARKNFDNDAAAFKIWSHSSLQRESLNSAVVLYDRSLVTMGSFRIGMDPKFNPADYLSLPQNTEPEISELRLSKNSDRKVFAGIIPLVYNNKVIGFAAAAVDLDIHNIVSASIPDFLESKKNILSSVIDIRQLKIFEIEESKLTNVYGDIYPSRDQIKPLLNLKLGPEQEAWLSLNLNDEKYITYVLGTPTDSGNKITAVSLIEKQVSWNLFNFFKIFIMHSLFILALLLVLSLIRLRNLKYSFRTQLLIAFLVISIFPVFLLAIYNRYIFSQRSQAAVFSELNERSDYLKNHVIAQREKTRSKDFVKAFENAGTELGISFAVYEGTDQVYNSRMQFYDAGLFDKKLNAEAYYNLSYLSYREFFTKENIEGYTYNALYKNVSFDNRNFILEVNDAFNKVNVTFSVIDADVFLFGVYSFAVIIIIVISTFLANRISSPIRRLTKATDSVAHGDLNVYIVNKEKGELRELFEGFNMMTKELKKNEMELTELERENAWKEMAKQVAHEIKNPLTPMKLAIQQLVASFRDKNKNFDDMFEKLSVTILNQIENLSSIASEFSRFAKMPNLNLEEIDIIPVLKDTVNLFVDEKIKIVVASDYDNAMAEADKAQFRRMIINFIRNSIQADATSIKFTVTHEEASEAAPLEKPEKGHFYILIEDNGKGIPENVIDKIFEHNFTTKEKGMGIGLKLSKRFLEGINGKIELVQSTSEGTVFKICIPEIINTEIN